MASTNSGGKCSVCGKILMGGLRYANKGRIFCYDCYQKETEKIIEEDNKKDKIFDYIKKQYQINDLPESIVSGISRLFKDGYKQSGLLYTLYYMYEIKCLDFEPEFLIINIKNYYDEAKQYLEEQKIIEEKNKQIDLNIEPVNIVIKKEDLEKNAKKKISYKIEDL